MNARTEETDKLIGDYMHFTKEVLPSMARRDRCDWQVREDHCFQRIVLDVVCRGICYKHLSRPAYKASHKQPSTMCRRALPRYCIEASRSPTAESAIPCLAWKATTAKLKVGWHSSRKVIDTIAAG